jgi:hypothetical protein
MSNVAIFPPPDPQRYSTWEAIKVPLYKWLYSAYRILLRPMVLEPISQPTNPVEGMIYPDKDDNHFYIYLGGAWKQLD